MKKGDLLIVFILILATCSWFLRDYIWPNTGKNFAVIAVNGEHYQTLSMNSNTQFKINFPNNKYMELTIENKEIWISEKTITCPQEICLKTGKISKPGESIVCLPNKTVIYIEGFSENQLDDIAF